MRGEPKVHFLELGKFDSCAENLGACLCRLKVNIAVGRAGAAFCSGGHMSTTVQGQR